jgi:hypothetical protein
MPEAEVTDAISPINLDTYGIWVITYRSVLSWRGISSETHDEITLLEALDSTVGNYSADQVVSILYFENEEAQPVTVDPSLYHMPQVGDWRFLYQVTKADIPETKLLYGATQKEVEDYISDCVHAVAYVRWEGSSIWHYWDIAIAEQPEAEALA